MRKRLGLFIVGFVLVMGAFLLYQYVTGASVSSGKQGAKPRDVFPPFANHEQTFEFRNRTTGELRYLIKAKSVVPTRDAAGIPLPGQYDVQEPEGTSYDKGRMTWHLQADEGHVILDPLPKAAKSAPSASSDEGDSGVPPFLIRSGELKGHVRLTIAGKAPGTSGTLGAPGGGSEKAPDGEIRITFDGPVEVLQNQNLLTSAGGVHVRSDTVEFDGAGLNLSYNRDAKRVEFLRIDKGNTMIVRKVGKGALGLGGGPEGGKAAGAATKPAEREALASGGAATIPGRGMATNPAATRTASTKPAVQDTTYKLSFGQSVVASVGGRSLMSHQLYVIFMLATPGSHEETDKAQAAPGTVAPGAEPATVGGGAGAAGTQAAATTQGTQPAPGEVGPNDLVIHWTGPMEMRPAGPEDVKLDDAQDAALEAVGTQQSPVLLRDGTRTVTAGLLRYHKAAAEVEIEPGDLPNVQLADPAQGLLICQGVNLFQAKGLVKLTGPGTMEVPQSAMKKGNGAGGGAGQDQTPLRASWTKPATVEYVNVPDAKNPSKQTQAIKRVVLTGDVAIRDTGFQMLADALDARVAYTGDPKTPQALEHLLATGNVRVKYARPGETLDDAAKPDGLIANQLEVFTTPRPGTHVPAPSEILATGDVTAWTYSEQKDEAQPAKAGGGGAANAPVAPAAKKLVQQTIYTPRLEVALEPKEAGTEKAGAKVAANDSGFSLGSGANMKSLRASDGVKVEIVGLEGSGNRLVVATSQTLAADRDGKAVLEGDAGINEPGGIPKRVVIMEGDNQIVGDRVLLDQKAHSIEVPGPGIFSFVEPGKKGEPDSTVQIKWSRKMTYDDRTKLARFTGHIESKLLNKPDQDSEMTCEQSLEVTLNSGHEAGAAKGEVGSDSTGRLSKLLALGDVKATGITYEPGTKTVATKMVLRANEVQYSGDKNVLYIPVGGSITIEDYRVDKADKKAAGPDSKGITAFVWDKNLTYTGQKNSADAGTIRMVGNVRMRHIPTKPFQMPGSDGKAPPVKEIHLIGDTLTAYLAQSKDVGGGKSVSSPVGLGSGGDMKMSRAIAEGNPTRLDMGDDSISGASLGFDSLKNVAVARGNSSVDAQVIRPGEAMVTTPDDITWDMATHTFKIPHPRGNIQLR